MLPRKAFSVQPLFETVRAVDPSAVAVSESSPVVGFAPNEQATRGMLYAIACRIVVFILQTFANSVMTDDFSEGCEAENELAV